MKVKSSLVLSEALVLIENGAQTFVCAAIQDVETTMRWAEKEDIKSKALSLWMTFKPERVLEQYKTLQQWWEKGDPERVETLKLAIAAAKKRND
jgi:hypothetical protein